MNLDGAPVDPEHIDRMRNAMAHWGPDGVQTWREGCAGLGQCLLYNTPEAVHERLPYASSDGMVAFTAEARIDNRDELFGALNVPHPERATMPDGALILRAYEKWGEDSPDHLLGDWSFAVWHPHERRLFLARDHSGVTALYYFHDGRRFAFASDRRAVLTLPNIPHRLNELYLAQVLVGWGAYHGPETIYLDVHRLGCAQALVVSGCRLRTWRFWSLEDEPVVRLARADDYADGLREQLQLAVRRRTRSLRPIATSLSGGLDSGSVAVLAARELATNGRSLLAFTSVPLYETPNLGPSVLADEFPMASATIKRCGNVGHFPVAALGISPMAGIEWMLDVHGEPGRNAGNYYWLKALYEAARDRGAGVLLTGQFGNQSISWEGLPTLAHAAAALAFGEIGEAAREIKGWVGSSRPLRPYRRWRSARTVWTGRQPWHRYSPIHPDFAESLHLRERMAQAGYDPTFSASPVDARTERLKALRPGRHLNGFFGAELAAASGVEGRDPTSDARLLAFVFGIPNRFWRGPLNRWLIRHAMSGLLPDDVRLDRRKGRQAADVVPRILANPSEKVRMLEEVTASALARLYLDVDYLFAVDSLMGERSDGATKLAADAVFLRGLGAGAFVARAF